jgi:hypothetical protein
VPRTFTIDEANALLPTVSPIVSGLKEAWGRLEASKDAVNAAIARHPHADLGGGQLGQAAADSLRVQSAMMRLHRLGVVAQHPGSGLVDFPSRLGGRPIMLCWRLGETRVGHWHTPEAGFAGRRPIDELDEASPGG